MLAAILASSLVLAQQPAATPPAQDPVYQVEDVVVDGRRLDRAATEFVAAVTAPARGRGPARWDEGVCVGAVNFQPELAQYLVDRVSDTVRDLGLRAHTPPCHPSVLIIGTTDGAAFARGMIEKRPRLFRAGGSGMDRGGAALDAFRSGERAVRWWHVSAPVDSETGQIAVRLPGYHLTEVSADGQLVERFAPEIVRPTASRLATPLEDVMKRSIVVVDVDLVQGVSTERLADYITFVALAQVDPGADTGRFESILNLFDDPEAATGLSPWDLAYLEGLYGLRSGFVSPRQHTSALSRAIVAAYRESQTGN